jgi:NADH:ubiquinone oxidoreductase subunit D
LDHSNLLLMVFLRLIAELNGWSCRAGRSFTLAYYIVDTEKLAEYRTYLQILPLFWSLKIMFQQCHKNICYVLAFRTFIKY